MIARHGVHLFADVDVALCVALERSVVNSGKRLEHIDATESFSTGSADVSVWEHVALFLVNFRSRVKLCVQIQTDVAQLLLDIPSSLPLCSGSERVHTVPLKSGRSNTSAQRKMFRADGDEVFVWWLVGLLLVHFRGRLVHCRNPRRSSSVSLSRHEQTLSLQQASQGVGKEKHLDLHVHGEHVNEG